MPFSIIDDSQKKTNQILTYVPLVLVITVRKLSFSLSAPLQAISSKSYAFPPTRPRSHLEYLLKL